MQCESIGSHAGFREKAHDGPTPPFHIGLSRARRGELPRCTANEEGVHIRAFAPEFSPPAVSRGQALFTTTGERS